MRGVSGSAIKFQRRSEYCLLEVEPILTADLMLDRDGFLDPPRGLLQPFKMDQSPAVLRTAVSDVVTT